MMCNWGKKGGRSHHPNGHAEKWDYPGPSHVKRWREAVPKWERDFCAMVGQVPWPRLIEIKRWYQDENVLEWKDSAVKETFETEKARYWARINGQPCNSPFPDPDLFIDDEIDWNSSIDPQLFLDLEKAKKIPSDVDDEIELKIEDIVPTGWGSVEEEQKQNPICGPIGWPKIENIIPTGWGEEEDIPKASNLNSGPQRWEDENNGNDSWKQSTSPPDETAKENGKNSSWGPRKKKQYGSATPETGNGRTRRNIGGRRNWNNGGNGNDGRRWKGNSSSGRKGMQIWVPVKD